MKLKSTFLTTAAVLAAGSAAAVELDVYGQVNKLVVNADNGVESNTAIVDNDTSSTRVGFKAQQQLDNGLVVSALLELQSESNSSYNMTVLDDNEEDSGITERHSRIGVSSKYGTFLIGKTSEATDGIAEMDLGGVQDVMYSDINSIGGSLDFVQANGTATVSVKDLYVGIDGSRTNLVRYDTPAINGISGSTSLSSGGDVALAAKYTGGMTDAYGNPLLKIKAGVGYKAHESNKDAGTADSIDKDISGSVSVLHEPTGLAATVALGNRSYDSNAQSDADFMYTKLSYLPKESSFEYAVDYATSENGQDQEIKSYGAGAQYNIARGLSSSVMFRQLEADKLAADVEDIQLITAGLKVKF